MLVRFDRQLISSPMPSLSLAEWLWVMMLGGVASAGRRPPCRGERGEGFSINAPAVMCTCICPFGA
jgi:hypothetical protein